MDKTKLLALAEKCGIKPELAGKFLAVLEDVHQTRMAQLEADYQAKLDEAKKICVEEVNAHNRELSRRMQIFCEAKGVAIERSIAKQSALKESEALTKLQQIHSLLEGVGQNGEHSGNSSAEVKKLQRQIRKLSEDRNKSIETANRQTELASTVLKRNRLLESQIVQSKRRGGAPLRESTQPRSGRIDGTRQANPKGQPVSTRATLVENQDRNPQRPHQTTQTPPASGFTPDVIAATMDEDLV